MTHTMTFAHIPSLADGSRAVPADPTARPAPQEASKYLVGVADLDADGPEIAELWVENVPGYTVQRAGDRLRSGYLSNPAGLGFALLLREGEAGRLLGVQCLFPRRLHLGSRQLRAACLADFAVARSHRSLGPALMVMRAATAIGAERFDLVYGLPNASAAAVCRRAGLQQIGVSQRYVKVLRWRYLLARRMPRWAASSLCALARPFRVAYGHLRLMTTRPRLTCHEVPLDDPAVDVLWSLRSASLLLSERSARMLAWRFATAVGEPWRLFMATDKAGRPQGYVVWRQVGGLVEVGDLFAPEAKLHLMPMLLAFFGVAMSAGADSVSIEFTGPDSLVACLKAAGMLPREAPNPVFAVMPCQGSVSVVDPQHWYLTRFDNDAD